MPATNVVELSSCTLRSLQIIGGKTHTSCVVSTAVSTIPKGHYCVDTLVSQSQPACVVKRLGHRNSVSGAREWSCKCAAVQSLESLLAEFCGGSARYRWWRGRCGGGGGGGSGIGGLVNVVPRSTQMLGCGRRGSVGGVTD